MYGMTRARMQLGRLGVAFLALMLLAATGAAQIIIIPEPWPPRPVPPPHPPVWPPVPPREIPREQPVRLANLSVDAQVKDQVAEVRLSQTFRNPNGRAVEARYLFPVPEGSTIQDFVLMVDGKELAGELMDKDKARGIYEEIVRRQRDPGLLEWAGRGLLQTSVFPIPGHEQRTVTLKYTQLLPKEDDRLDLRLPLGAPGNAGRRGAVDAGRAEKIDVRVRLESATAIKTLYSPTDGVTFDRDGDHRATAKYSASDAVPPQELRIVAGLAAGEVGATLLSTRPSGDEDGAFLLLASPAVKDDSGTTVAKTVIFVLDRSGSMSGRKIEQARGALRFVLNNLNPGDTFNVIAYDSVVEDFRPELERYDAETRQAALRFVENIRAGGSTNIDAALAAALKMIPNDPTRPAYVIFMTDGLPTVGEKNELTIAGHAKDENEGHARIFTFGVGYDVNARLLDRISGGNGGTTEYVKPDDDIETAVGRFYGRMSSPVLSDLKLDLAGTDINRVEPKALPDLFRGQQLIVAGRYRKGGATKIRLTGRVGKETKTFEFPATLAREGEGSDNAFVARIWATRRIADLVDQIDLNGRNQELVDELVALSKRYGILTPYTSFLAREDTELAMSSGLRRQAGMQLEALDRAQSGAGGVALREQKQMMLGAATAPSASGYAMGGMDSATGMISGSGAGPGGGSFGGGMAGGRGSRAMPAMGGGGAAPAERPAAARETVRQVGEKTFYLREGGWIDSEAADRKDQDAKPETVKAYSDAWFDLARRLGPERAGWLDFDRAVTFWFDGKLYRVEPEATE